MARTQNKLTARQVAGLTETGRYSDGGGLYLVIDGSDDAKRRRWLFMFAWRGKRKEMGLGSASTVTLAQARAARDEAKSVLASGRDPIAEARAAKAEKSAIPTFAQAVDDFLESKAGDWRNTKHAAQWRMTLTKLAAPLARRQVDAIDTQDILAVLKPIWQKTPETASRLRGRIESVLDSARVRGFIHQNAANPARWRGHLEKLLSKRKKKDVRHHPAMPANQLPGFFAKLKDREGTAALALQFCILTAARSGEALNAQWDEIDFDKRLRIIPGARMKAGLEHRVPLSAPALAILEKMAEAKTGELVFPGQREGRPLSNMSMEMLMRRMKVADATVHGFRSSFRDWAEDEAHFPREVAEAALAHSIGDATEQAYRRGDALERRRVLMESWAAYCTRGEAENVVNFKNTGA